MIKDKLKEIREETGMNKKEFANYIGLKYTTYNGYETGAREPDSDFLILISKKFDVSIDYILGLQAEKEVLHSYQLKSLEYDHIKKYRCLDDIGKKHVDMILLWEIERIENLPPATPVIITAPMRSISYYQRLASAGTGQVVYGDIPVECISIPDLPEYARVSYAIGVNGNSMEPLYYDGDMLLIEPTCEVEPGEIGIFIVGSEAFVKKLGNGELISLNTDYGNIPLTSDSKCMGRVVDKISPDN